MRLSKIATTVLGFVGLGQTAQLTVTIPPSPPLLANPATLPPSTHATLVGAAGVYHDARLTRSNTLVFKTIAPGSYLLDIHTRDYAFPPFRVDVSVSEAGADGAASTGELVEIWQTFRGNEWDNKGRKVGEGTGEVAVTLSPTAKKAYYQAREGFNVIGFFKSPMILMGLFSAVMIFGMPYLLENMDPETKAEFEQMQKKSPLTGSEGAAAQIQNFDLASWMAGKTSDSGGSAKAKN